MTTQQKLYICLIKRPIGFLGALVGREDINSFEAGVATMENFNGNNLLGLQI